MSCDVVPLQDYHFTPDGAAASVPARRMKILFLSHVRPFNAATIRDHCESFGRYSRHDFYHFNPAQKEKPAWLDLGRFEAIVLHYSLSIITPYYLLPSWTEAVRDAKAVKILFIQDEYRQVDQHVERMQALGIDVLFTCVPFSEVTKVYSPAKLPDTRVFCTMTGFVPESLEKRRPDFHRRRPIDVGYRARDIGFWYGALGQEKSLIGRRFLELAQDTGLTCNIATREEDRIYGRKWVRFLQSCRCVLGSESGASVFDFTGDIQRKTVEYLKEHPAATFEQVRDLFFAAEDGKIRVNQISPRVFESIACGAGLVLFEGEYSGVVRPGVDFIPLKKDFSNFDEVVAKIKDEDYVASMAQRAYDHVIAPRQYSYQRFIEGFDRAVDMVFEERRPRAGGTAKIARRPAAARPSVGHAAAAVTLRVWNAVLARSLNLARRIKWRGFGLLLEWQPLYRNGRFKLLSQAFLGKAENRRR
jgi:hypothetical protein